MIFEDLAAATLEHCLRRNGAEHVAIRTEPVTTGQKKGPWLDRWIEADLACGQKVLFQTEIKSVSAHSTGQKRIMLNASVEEMRDHEQENWHGQWTSETNTLRAQPMAKVLVPSSWIINPKFGELWVFSISSYLRSIKDEISGQLDLPMPIASNKMRALQCVVQVPSQTD